VCGPEFSDLESAIHQQYSETDVMVLGLYDNEATDPDLQVFLNAFQVTFPVLMNILATFSMYAQSGGTSPYPLDYVIDQAGRVAYFNTEYDPEAMVEIIDELLLNPAPVGDIPGVVSVLNLEARPNPFNPRTEIHFRLPHAERVELDIHDARGHLVRRLVDGGQFTEGPNVVAWDGTDDAGRSLPSGFFLARIRAGGYTAITKLTLLR
jgi:hypothetical protein